MFYASFYLKLRKRLPLISAMAFLSLFISCQTNHWASRLDWTELSLEKLPDSSNYPMAHAVVLLDEGKVSIEGQGEIKLTHFDRHKVIRILDRGGLAYCNVVIPYTPGSSIVEEIKARTIHPDGRITVLDAKQIFDVFLYPNFIFYADQKAKKFTFPDVEPGDVLEFRYSMVFENLTLYHSWSFQNFIPVLRSRFEVSFPSSWKLHHKVYHYPLEPDSVKRPSGFKTIYRWQMKDIPALAREPAMPPVPDVAIYLLFAPLGFENWKDVANWYFELSNKRMNPTSEIKQFAQKLVKGANNEQQKLEIIYNWVRDHIRYIAIAIGIGSYQPHFASEVFKNRYGDCKDMVSLMCALGRAIDLKIYPVLVSTRQNGRLDTSLATPFRFNHVVALAQLPDGRKFYLDPTHKGAPFGYLPWYMQDVYGLVIRDNDQYELIHIKPVSNQNNFITIKGHIELKNDGNAQGRLSFTFHDEPAVQLRAALLPANRTDQKRWLENFLCQMDLPFKVKEFKINGLKNYSDSITLVVKFLFSPGKTEFDFVPGKLIQPKLWKLFRATSRVHPLQFGYRFTRQLDLALNFQSDWQLKSQPVTRPINSKFGSCNIRSDLTKRGQLKITGQFHLEKTYLSNEAYQDFRNFLDQAHQLTSQPIMFSK